MKDTKNKKLIGLATGKKTTTAKVVKKPVVVEKKITPEEDRNIKAKQTVERLLEGSSLIPKKDEPIFELITEKNQGNVEWLEEQLALLTSENEVLKNELATAKNDYAKLLNKTQNNGSNEFANETINQNILALFNELQNNLLGHNQERTVWTTANIPHLLNKMLLMFPFTANIKKF
jgi:hypothetical protein